LIQNDKKQSTLMICARPRLETSDQFGCAVCAFIVNATQESDPEDKASEKGPPSIDSHIHCGIQKRNKQDQSYEVIRKMLKRANIIGACLFSPVNEIYERYNKTFYDTPEYQQLRKQSNQYLLEQAQIYSGEIYPFYFVWNDYQLEGLENFVGIKWHRHSDEPHYDYLSDKCEAFLQRVYELKLPIVFEEEESITLNFIKRVGGRTPIIIPHLGLLNGGYSALKKSGIWKEHNVYADCSLAFSAVLDFIETYGAHKLVLGSDYPFGNPDTSKRKILEMHRKGKISTENLHMILYNNMAMLLNIKK